MLTEPVASIDEEQEEGGGGAHSYSHREKAANGNKTTDGENEDEIGSHVQENANEVEEEKEMEEEEKQQLEESRMFRLIMRHQCCARILRTFPRCFALLLGVVIPLFSLICISIFLGNWLSRLESPNEIIANDAILAAQMYAQVYSFIVVDSAVIIPPKCTDLFLRGEQHHDIGDEIQSAIIGITGALEISNALKHAGQPSDTLNETLLFSNNQTVSISNEELFNYMKSCGESARNISQTFLERVTDAINNASADLTFNWIRCYEGAHDLSYHESFQPSNSQYLPEEQEKFYTATWQVSTLPWLTFFDQTQRKSSRLPHRLSSGSCFFHIPE